MNKKSPWRREGGTYHAVPCPPSTAVAIDATSAERYGLYLRIARPGGSNRISHLVSSVVDGDGRAVTAGLSDCISMRQSEREFTLRGALANKYLTAEENC